MVAHRFTGKSFATSAEAMPSWYTGTQTRKLISTGLPPIPPWALISSIASVAPLRMNSPYPPSGPERIVWQPILIGFFSFRSAVAAPSARDKPSPATASAVDFRNRRRVVPRRGAMGIPPTAPGRADDPSSDAGKSKSGTPRHQTAPGALSRRDGNRRGSASLAGLRRQGDGGRRPVRSRRAHADLPAMCKDDLPRDEEAQSEPVRLLRARLRAAATRREDPREGG